VGSEREVLSAGWNNGYCSVILQNSRGEGRHYYYVAFVFDRRERRIVREPQINADRSCFPAYGRSARTWRRDFPGLGGPPTWIVVWRLVGRGHRVVAIGPFA